MRRWRWRRASSGRPLRTAPWTRRLLAPHLPQLVPLLLRNMVYGEFDEEVVDTEAAEAAGPGAPDARRGRAAVPPQVTTAGFEAPAAAGVSAPVIGDGRCAGTGGNLLIMAYQVGRQALEGFGATAAAVVQSGTAAGALLEQPAVQTLNSAPCGCSMPSCQQPAHRQYSSLAFRALAVRSRSTPNGMQLTAGTRRARAAGRTRRAGTSASAPPRGWTCCRRCLARSCCPFVTPIVRQRLQVPQPRAATACTPPWAWP